MKLIKASFEILDQGMLLDDMYKHIELCGRTCYKSEDKITPRSAFPFVEQMINSKHYAMLEHGTVYLEYHIKNLSEIGEVEYNNQQQILSNLINKYEENKYSIVKVNPFYDTCFITTNYRVIIENKWTDDLKYLCDCSVFHAKRVTVKFTCNRQVSHEFVRHRVFSFAQESTRYCNYTKGKFGDELTFIEPCWSEEREDLNVWYDVPKDFTLFYNHLLDIEDSYKCLIRLGWKPQQAATILPNTLKTELIMTGFVDDWKHFFNLRAKGTTGAPHPQAKELAEPLMNEFIKRGYMND